MRNLRIRQLLLLLLRTLIILLLVLAFARPTLQSEGGGLLSERSPIEAVIILDNSLSLNQVHLTGTLLDQLRQAFSSLENVFQSGDRITIIQSSVPLQVLSRQENFQANLWERTLPKLQSNYLKSDLDNAILMGLDRLQQSIYSGREMYIISDFQQSGLAEDELAEKLERPEYQGIRLFVLPIRHKNTRNISIDSVEVVNRLIEINQPLQINAYLRNHHPEDFQNTLASMVLNGDRVAQKNVNLEAGQITEVPFKITLTENGFVEGNIEIESDALAEDNQQYFNFYVPKQIKTLHIYPNREFDSFIPLIIQPAQERGIFKYTQEVFTNWSNRNFMEYDVIVLEGLNQIPETLVLRLQNFVDRGGGLWIIPGDQIVIPNYQELFDRFSLGKMVNLQGKPGQEQQFLSLGNVQWNHPIFESLFSGQKGQLNPIEIYASYKVNPGQKVEQPIQLSDRSPLLLHQDKDKGTVFSLTSPLQSGWSQLPVKGFVVPLSYRIIYYSGTRKVSDRQKVATGKVFQQQFPNLDAPFNFQVSSAREKDIKLTPQFKGSTVFLEFRNTEVPGNYRILHNGSTISLLSVNHWREESQMNFYEETDIREILGNVYYFADYNDVSNQVEQRRFGKELWKYFLILAFILLLIEMLVARTSMKSEYSEITVKEASLPS